LVTSAVAGTAAIRVNKVCCQVTTGTTAGIRPDGPNGWPAWSDCATATLWVPAPRAGRRRDAEISQIGDGDAAPDGYARARALIALEPTDGQVGLVGHLQRLCRSLTRSLSVRGVVVCLISPTEASGVAAGSDDHCRELEELQFTTGEGPCHDAFLARRPILIADLHAASERWPGYVSAAAGAGVGGVFVFPLQVGAVGLGALSVFADRAGSLTDEQVSTGLSFADIATELLLDHATTDEGQIDPGLEQALGHRAEIYQAQGMVMIALGVTLLDALVRMRAHAFSHDQSLIDLAREIISDRGRLDRGL
jgi:hypothetical protein